MNSESQVYFAKKLRNFTLSSVEKLQKETGGGILNSTPTCPCWTSSMKVSRTSQAVEASDPPPLTNTALLRGRTCTPVLRLATPMRKQQTYSTRKTDIADRHAVTITDNNTQPYRAYNFHITRHKSKEHSASVDVVL